MDTFRRSIAAWIVAGALLVTSAGTARAQESALPVDAVAQAVADVVPETLRVVVPSQAEGSLRAATGGTTVVAPRDASEPLSIYAAGSPGAELRVSLPRSESLAEAQLAADGTIVYAGAADVAFAVQQHDGGSTRFLAVAENAGAPERYEFAFEGMKLTKDVAGSVLVQRDEEVVATVERPWAYDAAGNAVETWYEVEGDILIQIVNHRDRGVEYPVVADPKVSLGLGIYYHFNRAETKTLAQWGVGGAVALTTGCAALGALAAGAGAAIAGSVCAAYGGPFFFEAGVAQNSKPKKCVYLRIRGPVWTSGTYSDSRCK